jgi:molybdopterin converting factor small subunit
MAEGQITITNIEKTEKYELNGVCGTVADAISKFFNGDAFDGVVKVGGLQVEDRDMELRNGDVVLLLAPAVAGGNIKGA